MKFCCLSSASSCVAAKIFGDFSVITLPTALPVPMRLTSACTYQRWLGLPLGFETGAGCSAAAERPGYAEGADAEGAGGGLALLIAMAARTAA